MQTEVLPELRPSIATEAAQVSGVCEEASPIMQTFRLLHLTCGQLRPIPTMGATSHLYKGEEVIGIKGTTTDQTHAH